MRLEKRLVGSAPDKLPVREGVREAASWKRSEHGGSAWTAANAGKLHQPQDGAPEAGTLLSARTRLFREPEDARLTGGTRSLMRRVMGLNVTALAETRKAPRAMPAKPHAQVA